MNKGNNTLLIWLSLVGLDAPLVAWVWGRLWLGQGSTLLFGLAAVVWSIYLFDRLWDTRGSTVPSTVRHQFAARHRILFKVLFCLALGITIVESRRVFSLELWSVVIVSLTVAGYFLVFKWASVTARLFPWKEALIGLCFASSLAILSWPSSLWQWVLLVCFGILCSVNCLIIAKVERDVDGVHDVGAFFAGADRRFPFGYLLAFIATVSVFSIILSSGEEWRFAIAISFTAVGMIMIHRFAHRLRLPVQAVIDLWMWIAVFFLILV